jgi:hypothetical protein
MTHDQIPGIEVDVLSRKSEQLALPQARPDRRHVQRFESVATHSPSSRSWTCSRLSGRSSRRVRAGGSSRVQTLWRIDPGGLCQGHLLSPGAGRSAVRFPVAAPARTRLIATADFLWGLAAAALARGGLQASSPWPCRKVVDRLTAEVRFDPRAIEGVDSCQRSLCSYPRGRRREREPHPRLPGQPDSRRGVIVAGVHDAAAGSSGDFSWPGVATTYAGPYPSRDGRR